MSRLSAPAFHRGRQQWPDPEYAQRSQAHTCPRVGPDFRDPSGQPPRRECSAGAQQVGEQVGRESEQLIAPLPVEHHVDAEIPGSGHQRLPDEQVRCGGRQAPAIDVLECRLEDRGAVVEGDQLDRQAGVSCRRLDQLALIGLRMLREDASEREPRRSRDSSEQRAQPPRKTESRPPLRLTAGRCVPGPRALPQRRRPRAAARRSPPVIRWRRPS